MAKTTPPPGTSDIFPAEAAAWLQLENTARRVFQLYGYGEIRTPVFEFTEVFQRGLGDQTEVVKKEMYTFEDRGGRSLTLRPEGTAGVMRALAGTEAMNGVETRVFYMGPMFRGERPAAGRRRQFHQVGVENASAPSPGIDAECILMLLHFLEEAGITGASVKLNTRGVPADRKDAENVLREHFAPHVGDMCEDCKVRFEHNIWRILDCKQPQCQQWIDAAPDAASLFGQDSRDYFRRVCDLLAARNVEFKIEPRLVRGLDYYVHTVFELTHAGLGAQNAIAGGGRYQLLTPGATRPINGVGFAAGMERLLIARDSLGAPAPALPGIKVFLLSLGERALLRNAALADELRRHGISCFMEYEAKSMKSQMRSADRLHAEQVFILGDNELDSGIGQLKSMATGEQKAVPVDGLKEVLA